MHYNSFTNSEFFLSIDKVEENLLSLTDDNVALGNKMPTTEVLADMLKRDLICNRCGKAFPNMPMLKRHLKDHFDKTESI